MKQNKQITDQTNTALEQSIETLSPEVQSRLQHARSIALKGLVQKNSIQSKFDFWSFMNVKVISTGLACSFLAVLIWPLMVNQTIEQAPANLISSNSELSEFILLNNFDDNELDVIEDIEFAYWLSQELDQQGELHHG